jgi:hypothetical protein
LFPSLPLPPLSRKRPRDKDESFHDRKRIGPVQNSATGSAKFVVDLERANEVEVVSPHKKRRGAVRSERSAMNEAAGNCVQIRKAVKATEKDVGSEDVQVTDHRESHEGIAAAAATSHPMDSDFEQRRRDDASTNKRSHEVSTSKLPSNASGHQWMASAWEDRLSELAAYRTVHGHCNVPQRYSEHSMLGNWVQAQRTQYRLHLEGKPSPMPVCRIWELKSLDFEWDSRGAAWDLGLSELTDYRKTHGHCNNPRRRKGIAYDHLPNPGIGKRRFRMEAFDSMLP